MEAEFQQRLNSLDLKRESEDVIVEREWQDKRTHTLRSVQASCRQNLPMKAPPRPADRVHTGMEQKTAENGGRQSPTESQGNGSKDGPLSPITEHNEPAAERHTESPKEETADVNGKDEATKKESLKEIDVSVSDGEEADENLKMENKNECDDNVPELNEKQEEDVSL